jgi:hypothetical protein
MNKGCQRVITALFVLVVLGARTGSAAAQSIVETTAQGKPVDLAIQLELPDVSLADLITAADLVVQGTVRDMKSSLTTGGTSINTDLTVEVHRILRAKQALTPQPRAGAAQRGPGQLAEIVVRVPGGELDVNGQRARVIYSDLPVSDIKRGAAYLFFLVASPKGSEKFLAGTTAGIFHIGDGRVRPLANQFRQSHRELVDIPLADFEARLR